jgi:hypothetical protein
MLVSLMNVLAPWRDTKEGSFRKVAILIALHLPLTVTGDSLLAMPTAAANLAYEPQVYETIMV